MHPKHKNTVIPNDDEPTFKEWIAFCEKLFIEDALRSTSGNIAAARRTIGIPRSSMQIKLKQLGINAKDFKR